MTARIARLWRKAGTFGRDFPWWQKLLVPVVIVGLGFARLAVLTLPFRWYAPVLGARRMADGVEARMPADPAKAVGLSRVIRASAAVTPWVSNCLPQAMVAAWLLRRFGIAYAVYLGLRRDQVPGDRPLEAHAWTIAGDVPVTGYRESRAMTPVAAFVWPAALALS